jgi:cyclic-di-AMP phosphodiesterase PgpH
MRLYARLSGAARAAILVIAIVFTALALTIGRVAGEEAPILRVGDPSPQTFIAERFVSVVDVDDTEARRSAAADAVADVTVINEEATIRVLNDLSRFFTNVRRVAQQVVDVNDEDDNGEVPPDDTTTIPGDDGDEGDETTTTTLPPEPPPREEQVAELLGLHPLVREETIATIVDLINDDPERVAVGEEPLFDIVRDSALAIANTELQRGIRSEDLQDVRSDLVTSPPPLPRIPEELQPEVRPAVARLVEAFLIANERVDDQATETERQRARDAVADVVVEFEPGFVIVRAGDRVTNAHFDAIQQLGLLDVPDAADPLRSMSVIAALVVLLAAVFMARVAGSYWQQPKLVGLLGLLVVLAAVASRVPELVARDRVELGFLLPAALFGYLAANLFDARIAAFMAVPVSAFTALATGDIALTVFAGIATLAPVPLVSSVASRSQLNMAVVFSAAIQVPLVAALAWRFYGEEAIMLSMVWGFIGGLVAGIIALGILPILSTAFAITTTQTLLDLTDRNHPALRRIEETAPGTFNHSVLVGNLADRAARAVGANPLLARAMAYYHDLGKTVQPRFFVENQFGVTNPHDRLPPEESAAIIRSHVAEGLRLAREYRIPPDVAQGILTHHGTSLMRFFLHKAGEVYGDDVNPAEYRHRGRKPKSKEMVILMLADATEAGTRALAQHEDPTSEGIRGLVENVITEKVEDGQLEESDVTFGELTRIKEAFVDALISYYHTRIPYPGFPGRAQST